jgi:hypothetical protein
MPENSEGGENSSGERGTSDGQSNRHNNHSRYNTTPTPRETHFEGSCEDLKGSVYDVTIGKDTFLKTTRKFAEYVDREYSNAGEYHLAMINLSILPPW